MRISGLLFDQLCSLPQHVKDHSQLCILFELCTAGDSAAGRPGMAGRSSISGLLCCGKGQFARKSDTGKRLYFSTLPRPAPHKYSEQLDQYSKRTLLLLLQFGIHRDSGKHHLYRRRSLLRMLPADRSKIPCGYCNDPVWFVPLLQSDAGLLLLQDRSADFDQFKRL